MPKSCAQRPFQRTLDAPVTDPDRDLMKTHFQVPAHIAVPNAIRHTFTVEQANRMLPLVQRIAADLTTDYRSWQLAVQEFEARVATGNAESGDPIADGLKRTVRRFAADIQRYLGELDALGIECKGIEEGLIDFPGEMDGTPVSFCWMLGEPSVAFWHTSDGGFEARQPIVAVAGETR